MKKKLFIFEYFLQGLIVSAAVTNFISPHIFIMLFLGIFSVVYWKDGLQSSTCYYIPIAIGMLLGEAMQIQNISAYSCIAVVYLQYIDSPVYHLPENKKLIGFRKMRIYDEDEEYFEFYPLAQNGNIRKTSVYWDQGKAFEKIIESKQTKGVLSIYHRLSLSYIRKMPIVIGEGQYMPTKVGMAFCHGRDAAPMWYSSLLIHFASNNIKVGARQHASLAKFDPEDSKEQMKKRRQRQAKRTAQQYYQTIQALQCEKLILVAHSYGCSALLQAYHEHFQELSSKVTHIILLDPYFFPLADELLFKPVSCPVLVLANQYLLNFEDVHQRFSIFTSKKNVSAVVWKEGSDLYQTDLCCFLSNQLKLEEWQSKFTTNFEAINIFMLDKKIENSFGDKDLSKKYKPEEYFPENLFIF